MTIWSSLFFITYETVFIIKGLTLVTVLVTLPLTNHVTGVVTHASRGFFNPVTGGCNT